MKLLLCYHDAASIHINMRGLCTCLQVLSFYCCNVCSVLLIKSAFVSFVDVRNHCSEAQVKWMSFVLFLNSYTARKSYFECILKNNYNKG